VDRFVLAFEATAAIAVLAACSSETLPGRDPPTMGPWGGSAGVGAGSGGFGATGAGGAGAAGAGGQGAAAGGGTPCVDTGLGEANETEETAYPLSVLPITDCDGAGGLLSGVIAGSGDVDWFTYRGTDTLTCGVDPTVLLDTTAPDLRVCLFLECVANTTTEIGGCPAGSDAAVSPSGRAGCCDSTGITLDALTCTGSIADDSFVYMRVDHPAAPPATCDSYVLSYHF
jgi:hypothetical protein